MFVELISKCSVFLTNVIFLKNNIFLYKILFFGKKKNKKTFSENFNSFENNIISVEVAKVLLMIVTRK
jgi:hypothetical protein